MWIFRSLSLMVMLRRAGGWGIESLDVAIMWWFFWLPYSESLLLDAHVLHLVCKIYMGVGLGRLFWYRHRVDASLTARSRRMHPSPRGSTAFPSIRLALTVAQSPWLLEDGSCYGHLC